MDDSNINRLRKLWAAMQEHFSRCGLFGHIEQREVLKPLQQLIQEEHAKRLRENAEQVPPERNDKEGRTGESGQDLERKT